jgi:hypothetical protein
MNAELFAPAGIELPHTRVALGWPKKKSARGECWSDEVSSDGSRQIFISPKMVEPINDAGEGILEVLAHELCHAALPFGVGHGPRWKRTCRQIDLIPLPKGRAVWTINRPAKRQRDAAEPAIGSASEVQAALDLPGGRGFMLWDVGGPMERVNGLAISMQSEKVQPVREAGRRPRRRRLGHEPAPRSDIAR